MDNTRIEVAIIEKTVREAETQLQELNDLQLALIGGGIGNTII
jgi:hypothetical protein